MKDKANLSKIQGQNIYSREFVSERIWEKRWLTGEEYFHILRKHEEFCSEFTFEKSKKQPSWIYFEPRNGCIFFLKTFHTLRSLGFPRIESKQKKLFKWKKMNFVTLLPKNDPLVLYIVASARCESKCYRMHIVSHHEDYNKNIKKDGSKEKFLYLCHMLEVEPENIYFNKNGEKCFKRIQRPSTHLNDIYIDENDSDEEIFIEKNDFSTTLNKKKINKFFSSSKNYYKRRKYNEKHEEREEVECLPPSQKLSINYNEINENQIKNDLIREEIIISSLMKSPLKQRNFAFDNPKRLSNIPEIKKLAHGVFLILISPIKPFIVEDSEAISKFNEFEDTQNCYYDNAFNPMRSY